MAGRHACMHAGQQAGKEGTDVRRGGGGRGEGEGGGDAR